MCNSKYCSHGHFQHNSQNAQAPIEWKWGGEHDPYAEQKRAEQEARRKSSTGYYGDLFKDDVTPEQNLDDNAEYADSTLEQDSDSGSVTTGLSPTRKPPKIHRIKEEQYASAWGKKTIATDSETQASQDFSELLQLSKDAQKSDSKLPKVSSLVRQIKNFFQQKLFDKGWGETALAKCGSGRHNSTPFITVNQDNEGRFSIGGVCTCDSPNCVTCSPYITRSNVDRATKLCEYWLSESTDNFLISAVFTAPHSRYGDSIEFSDAMRSAKDELLHDLKRLGKKLGVELITQFNSTEVTGSRLNGFHPHFNITFLARRINEKRITKTKIKNALLEVWNKCLERNGLEKANKTNGVRVSLIYGSEEAKKNVRYMFKNVLQSILSLGLETFSAKSKTGAVKNGVRRWQMFELLIDSFAHREADPERSALHFDIFFEFLKMTRKLHQAQFGRVAIDMLHKIESNQLESDQQNVEDEKQEQGENSKLAMLITDDAYKVINKNELVYAVTTLNKTNLSGQELTDVATNVGRIDLFSYLLRENGHTGSFPCPKDYMSRVLSFEANHDLIAYIRASFGELADSAFLIQAIEERATLDFDDIKQNYDKYVEEYRNSFEFKDKSDETAKAKEEALLREMLYLDCEFAELKRKYPNSLAVRLLTEREMASASDDLYREAELELFIGFLLHGISPTDFIREMKQAENPDEWAKTKGVELFPNAPLEFLQMIVRFWIRRPERVIENYYLKWETRLRTPFDYRSSSEKYAEFEANRKARQEQRAKKQAEIEAKRKARQEQRAKKKAEAEAKRKEREERKEQRAKRKAEIEAKRKAREERRHYTRNRKEFTVAKSKHWNRNGLCL